MSASVSSKAAESATIEAGACGKPESEIRTRTSERLLHFGAEQSRGLRAYCVRAHGRPQHLRRTPRLTGLGLVTLVLALLALAAPFSAATYPTARVGWLLALAAGIEGLHALRCATAKSRRQATISALISMAIALFLISAPLVAARALRLVIAGWFAIDAARYAINALRSRAEKHARSRHGPPSATSASCC